MHQAELKIMVILLLLPQKSWEYKLFATTPCSICFFLKLDYIICTELHVSCASFHQLVFYFLAPFSLVPCTEH